MIVSVKDLLPGVRQPFLTALALRARAQLADAAGRRDVDLAGTDLARVYQSVIRDARSADLPLKDAPEALAEVPTIKELRKAAGVLWSIGLALLQRQIADGAFVPELLDLRTDLETDPALNLDPLRAGSHALGFRPQS
jgi:hypothetical protein